MRRILLKYIYAAGMFLTLSAAQATATAYTDSQIVNNRFRDNTFISTGAGVELNYTPGLGLGFNGKTSFVLDVSAGKWFTPSLGFRVGFQGLNFNDVEQGSVLLPGANAVPFERDGETLYNVRTEYDYLHADLLWNISNTIGGYRRDRLVSFIPYVHLGYEWLYNSFTLPRTALKRDYAGGAGMIASIRLNDNVSIYADLRAKTSVRHMLDAGGNNHQLGLSFYGMAGLTYNFKVTDWNKVGENDRMGYKLNYFGDNFFVGLDAGVASYHVFGESFGYNGSPEFTADLNVGKWFTPTVGLRVGLEHSKLAHYAVSDDNPNGYLTVEPALFHGVECNKYSFGFNSIHGDILWNVHNTFRNANLKRFWDPVPYASFAFGLSTSKEKGSIFRNDFLAGMGLYNRFHLTSNLALDFDVKARFLSGRPYGNTNKEDGIITNVTFGLSYDINNARWQEFDHAVVRRPAGPDNNRPTGPLTHPDFLRNSYVTLLTGVNMSFFDGEMGVAPGMELSFSKWFHPDFGFRIGVGGLGRSVSGSDAGFVYPHADFLLSIVNLIKWDNTRRYDIAPYIGAGYMATFNSSNLSPKRISSGTGWDAGVFSSYQIGKRSQANLDLRFTKAPDGIFASGLVGLSYALGDPRWLVGSTRTVLGEKDRAENVERVVGYILNTKIFDNTFISYSAGLNTFDFDGVGTSVDISAGKWFTPAIGLRLGYQGRKTARESGDLYRKVNTDFFHADLLWDPVSTFAGYSPERVYFPALYAEVGVMRLRDPNGTTPLGTEFTWGGGLLNTFKVSDRLSLILDLKGAVMNDTYTRSNPENPRTFYGSALAGVQYAFGRTTWYPGVADTEVVERGRDRERPWALSTNILGYADLLTVNLEAQYALGRHWSLSMQGKSNNLIIKEKEENQVMDRKSVAAVGVKYWPWYVYSGLWGKAFVQTEGYSRSNLTNNMGFEKGNAYGAGAAFGYSLIINRWFNIDFGLGVWSGYRTSDEYRFPDVDVSVGRTGTAFIDLTELSVSAMFVF